MIDFQVSGNFSQITKQLQLLQRNMPKVTSRAMQRTTEKARDDARRSATLKLDKPRPATLKAIRNRWPNRQQVIAGNATGAVFIAPFLVNEIYPNVFREVERQVPKAGSGIAQPTRKLRVNSYGNIPALRQGSLKRRRQNKAKFLDVPLNNTSSRTKHLPAGLYQIKAAGRRRKLVMIVAYRNERIITPKWSEYPRVVRQSYQNNFGKFWLEVFQREVSKL